MAQTTLLPDAFGSSWDLFVDKWCLGSPSAIAPDSCARALLALEEHWPKRVQALVLAPTRGLGVAIGAIDIGLALADTAQLVGFGPVLARLTAGERSAFSELLVAATFSRLGFQPILEMLVGTKVPDLTLTVGSTSVNVEVIAPNRAEIVKAATDRIEEIASAILAANPVGNIELFLDFDPDSVDVVKLAKTIADSPNREQPEEISTVGRFLKRAFSFPPVVTPSMDSGTSGTVLGAARSVGEGNNGGLVIVRVAVFDGRAKRLLAGELHHFSKTSPNVLVIDSGGVPGGVNDWLPSLSQCFQPNQNTRMSAVILYQTGLIGTPLGVHRAWRVLVNPYAANSLPKDLLEALTTLPSKWPV